MLPHTQIMSPGNTWLEIGVRSALGFIFIQLEKVAPFKREIREDELFLYKYPRTADYVPINLLFALIIIIPIIVFMINYVLSRDRNDLSQGLLALSLSLTLNGVLTDMVKLMVGRPRPDYFWRCFPDGHITSDMHCTGDARAERDGRKSFPSGHSSFAFAGFGFLAWYLMGKFQIFHQNGRGQSLRLILCFSPLVAALVVAISRTCDYHHHWQDVLVGSMIGLSLAYLCYRQYYPPLNSPNCNRSYLTQAVEYFPMRTIPTPKTTTSSSHINENDEDCQRFIDESEKDVKWI